MQFRNMLGAVVTVAAACLAMSAPASAQTETFATINSESNKAFTYVTGAAGGFEVNSGLELKFKGKQVFPDGNSEQAEQTVRFFFTAAGVPTNRLKNVGVADVDGVHITQALSGGSFTVLAVDNSVLLTGDFVAATLKGDIGDVTGSVKTGFEEVTYTGGSYFTDSGLVNPGDFSIALNSITQPLFLNTTGPNAGYLRGFVATGVGNFSATLNAVPEPGEYAVMGMAGLTVCGLMVRARRRRSVNGMAS